VKIDACMYRFCSLPVTVAFGHILNAVERFVSGCADGSPVKDRCRGHTHTYRVHVSWESTTVLQDQLLAGCWRGQAASNV